MKTLKGILAGLLLLTAFSIIAQSLNVVSSGSGSETSARVLVLSGSDVHSLRSLSDEQLAAFMGLLNATPVILPDSMPRQGLGGTFWSLKNPLWPPFPGNVNALSAWPMQNGSYLLSDMDFDYDAAAAQSRSRMQTMALDGPPIPGGGGDGGTNTIPHISLPPIDYGSNLWIAQVNLTNGMLTAIASNTLRDVEYEIFTNADLTTTNWISSGQFILGSDTTNWTALRPLTVSLTNNLFVRLRSNNSSDGSGLPDWWELEYGVSDPYGDPDGDGWNNLQEYQNGTDPNSFNTPAAPQGLTVSLHQSSSSAAISWLPAAGDVTGYTVEKTDSYANTVENFTTTTPSYLDDLSGNSPFPGFFYGDAYALSYRVKGNYANGSSSPWSASTPLQKITLSGMIISGVGGSNYLTVWNVPDNAVKVRLVFVENNAFLNYDDTSFDYNEDILFSSFTNGLYQLPPEWYPPSTDGYGYTDYSVYVASVDAEGNASIGTAVTEIQGANPFNWGPPFYDGRLQLKQNLIFQLRAALTDQPFYFYMSGDIDNDAAPTNYVYAGYHHVLIPSGDHGDAQPFMPFVENVLYENFVFNFLNIDDQGFIDTGESDDNQRVPSMESFVLTNPPAYYFQTPTSPWTNQPGALPAEDTRWLCSMPMDTMYGVHSSLIQKAGMYFFEGANLALSNDVRNLYGLKFLSAEVAYGTTNGVESYTLLAGNVLPDEINDPLFPYYAVYPEVEQPQFQTVEYDFFSPYTTWDEGTQTFVDPSLPGLPGFSPTNQSQLFITPIGSQVNIVSYAKLAVLNGYSGVYAYLGQYFDKAYQMTNGIVTTNQTGVLSPYGNFFATEPGPVALVTMPDIDTGERGTGTVYCVSLAVDANHDGNMDLTFNGADTTSANQPFILWANNNYDRWHDVDCTFGFDCDSEQDDLGRVDVLKLPADQQVPDCQFTSYGYPAIPCNRDLEDYFRLWTPGLSALMAAMPTNYTVQLTLSGDGQVRIFQAIEPDGGTNYLFDETTASNQVAYSASLYVGLLASSSPIILNNRTNEHFIICGAHTGSAQLDLQILDENQNIVADAAAYLQIKDIKNIYERWTVGDEPSKPPMDTAVLAANDMPDPMQPPFQYAALQDTNTPYILFVHGWNMNTYDKDRFAETAYKRLYWQGYQGRFGLFRWPTLYNFPAGEISLMAFNPDNFDTTEFQAWKSGAPLRKLLVQLNNEYPGKVRMFAHSHGNIAAGEALRTNVTLVHTYVAMQAAVPSHAYDSSTTNRFLGVWDSSTPERTAQYWTNGASCYFNNSAGAAHFANFYNFNDWALAWWIIDQNTKPDDGYDWTWEGTNALELYQYTSPLLQVHSLYFPTNTYEIFSYITEGRCFALGQQMNVSGVFDTSLQIDLSQPPYSFGNLHKGHSAEFRADNMTRAPFWSSVLETMDLK